MDLDYRAGYRGKMRLVDEILPLSSGIGLVVRHVAGGEVRWELEVLGESDVKVYRLPITESTPYARLKGDVRGGKIVLLGVNLDLKDTTTLRKLYLLHEPSP